MSVCVRSVVCVSLCEVCGVCQCVRTVACVSLCEVCGVC